MIFLKKGIFLVGTYSKLRMKKFDNGNAYEVELPDDMDISPIFNFANLYEFHESNDEFGVSNDYLKK